MNEFCAKKGIKREFSMARTPQQNGENRTLIEAARTMLGDSLLPIPFWAESVNTASRAKGWLACNHVITTCTPGQWLSAWYKECVCVPNADLPIDPNIPDLEDDSDAFSSDGIFNGAYNDENVGTVADFNNMDDTINVSPIPTLKIHKNHPRDQILGDPKSAVQTRGKI
ncbi:putative ribonuclease H-like domain-containing protein [Tanacetum coccineum]